jgi:hypothetical protein
MGMEGNYDISLSADHYGERVIHEDGRIPRKIEQRCPESGFLVVGVITGRESATKPMPSSYSYPNN